MYRNTSHRKIRSLFNRYVWLVDTIRQAQKITFDEICGKWCKSSLNESGETLPLRTFNNHRKAIEEMFGITIVCDKKAGNTYSIKNSDEIEKNSFRSWLLNLFSVSNLLYENSDLKDRILLEDNPSREHFLTPILDAMHSEVCLEISYQSYWHDDVCVFEVEPYCVKLFSQRWYLLGHSDQLRIYALDRIKSVNSTGKKFLFPAEFDPETYFSNSYGVLNAGKSEKVLIKAYKDNNRDKYLKSLPLHQSQQIIEQTEDFTIFCYFIQPTYDFRQELLSYGDEIEVLSPQWFRKEFSDIVEEQAVLYKETTPKGISQS